MSEDNQPFRCAKCGKPVSHINPGPCDCTKAKEHRIEVNTAGDPPDSWASSAIRFTDPDEAHDYAKDLFMRWTAVKYWRVIDDDDNVAFSNKEGEVNEDLPTSDSPGV